MRSLFFSSTQIFTDCCFYLSMKISCYKLACSLASELSVCVFTRDVNCYTSKTGSLVLQNSDIDQCAKQEALFKTRLLRKVWRVQLWMRVDIRNFGMLVNTCNCIFTSKLSLMCSVYFRQLVINPSLSNFIHVNYETNIINSSFIYREKVFLGQYPGKSQDSILMYIDFCTVQCIFMYPLVIQEAGFPNQYFFCSCCGGNVTS